MLSVAAAGELDKSSTVLRFYYIDSPPPLTVGLFFIHNHADGSYSGRLLACCLGFWCRWMYVRCAHAPSCTWKAVMHANRALPESLPAVLLLSMPKHVDRLRCLQCFLAKYIQA